MNKLICLRMIGAVVGAAITLVTCRSSYENRPFLGESADWPTNIALHKSNRLQEMVTIPVRPSARINYDPLKIEAEQNPQLALALKRRTYSEAWKATEQQELGNTVFVRLSANDIEPAKSLNYPEIAKACMAVLAAKTGDEVKFDFDSDPIENDGLRFGFFVEGNSKYLAKRDPKYRERYHIKVIIANIGGKLQSLMILDDAQLAYWDVDDGSYPDGSKFLGLPPGDEQAAQTLTNWLNVRYGVCLRQAG